MQPAHMLGSPEVTLGLLLEFVLLVNIFGKGLEGKLYKSLLAKRKLSICLTGKFLTVSAVYQPC